MSRKTIGWAAVLLAFGLAGATAALADDATETCRDACYGAEDACLVRCEGAADPAACEDGCLAEAEACDTACGE